MRTTRILGVVSLSVLAAGTLAAGAAAGTIPVKGVQTVIDEKTGAFEMHGSLVGKWNMTAFTERYKNPATYVGTGREKFVGCIDSNSSGTCDAAEPAGTMRFVFTYWATYDPATKALVRGACVHPVQDGTGTFASAKGVILMRDTPVGKTVRTTYTGTLTIPGVRAPAARALTSVAHRSCGL